jgi:Putative sensor
MTTSNEQRRGDAVKPKRVFTPARIVARIPFLAPLGERRTYVETSDLVLDLVVGVAWFSIFTTLVATGASLLFTLVGLPILTGTFYLARAAAALERRRALLFLATEIERPVRAPAHGKSLLQKLVTPFRDRTTWRELLYVSLVQPTQSVVNFSIAVTAWAMPVWALTLPLYATQSPPKLWTGERLNTWHETSPSLSAASSCCRSRPGSSAPSPPPTGRRHTGD